MSKFHVLIRVAEVIDPDYEGIEIQVKDCVAGAIAVARRIVAEAVMLDESVGDMTFEITDCEGKLVAELPFRCCARAAVRDICLPYAKLGVLRGLKAARRRAMHIEEAP